MSEKKLLARIRKSGIISRLKKNNFLFRLGFIATGILSGLWFLIRVLPKPQRATYPCMRVAAPWASAFVVYLLSLTGSVFSFRKSGHYFKISRYSLAGVFLIAGLVFAFITIPSNPYEGKSVSLASPVLAANDPIGVAKGIMPGRVVWVHDPDATDETCTNKSGDYWFMNTDADVVSDMLVSSIKNLAGTENINQAWDAIFKYFNSNHGKGETGYTAGEKIYIKINITNSCCPNWRNQTEKTNQFERMDATPEVCLALLKQLVEVVGVQQSNIYLGDPFRRFHDLYWDVLHTVYPGVHYMDGNGYNGREQTTLTSEALLQFSDGENQSRLPQEYVDAAYFINMPCLKTHDVGGITLAAKNHQGSIIQDGDSPEGQSAMFMHYALPGENNGHGKYRHLVDYMGHEQLGGKTLVYIVDGIWAGRNWDGTVEKWQMEPFNNDYPSSLIVSLDPVALESVGYDFLLEEYSNKNVSIQYPYIDGADDYMLQAADPANWPAGIDYDPEGDGSVLTSLGTHEHWNNATDKQYSRNLGTGNGIELVHIFQAPAGIDLPDLAREYGVFPNPVNSSATVRFHLNHASDVSFEIYSTEGRKVKSVSVVSLGAGDHNFAWIPENLKGLYVCKLAVNSGSMVRNYEVKITAL
jgi:hypothetical protein